MSLFDGKPLTESEVMRRLYCRCGDTYGRHRVGGACTACGCEEFVEHDPLERADDIAFEQDLSREWWRL